MNLASGPGDVGTSPVCETTPYRDSMTRVSMAGPTPAIARKGDAFPHSNYLARTIKRLSLAIWARTSALDGPRATSLQRFEAGRLSMPKFSERFV